MKKLILLAMIFLIIMSGCSKQQIFENDKRGNRFKTIEVSNAYHMSGQSFHMTEEVYDENTKETFVVMDEMELAKVAQYNIDIGNMDFLYQCEVNLDLDKVLEILSRLNPYDLSLKQTITSYTNEMTHIVTKINSITIENLDKNYLYNKRFAKRIADEIKQDKDNVIDRLYAIHDYIINNCMYAEGAGNTQDAYSAYGVFVTHEAVCTGYSRAFMLLAEDVGIPALFVVSEKMNHSWNYVYDGRSWRFIDVTWNDSSIKTEQHKYLDMSISEFKEDGKHMFDNGEEILLTKISNNFFGQ